jgi:predicted metal-dependent phosphoesterase TrpH
MNIDLHVHTKERSACGQALEVEQVQAAIAAGLHAIVLTDHHQLAPAEQLAALNAAYAPFRIFGGIEMSFDDEDFIILGVPDARLESRAWSYPAVHAVVRAAGGFLALAHPFRYHPDIRVDIEQFRPDAIEAYSINTPPAAAARITAVAAQLGLHPMSNSDAHTTATLGAYYNVLARRPADERELIAMLRAGQFSMRTTQPITATTTGA